MFRNELDRIKEDIKIGDLYRDIDESYVNGVWDLATNYVKSHHLNAQHLLKEKDIDLITNVYGEFAESIVILYDFIYDLLDEELENE
jgi:hypothetical protein